MMTEQESPPAIAEGPSNRWQGGLIVNLGVLALIGWLFGWVGFDAAPGWAVAGAFVAATLFQFLLKMVGQSVIEDGIIAIFVLVNFVVVHAFFDYPVIVPFLAGIVCGALGSFTANLFTGSTRQRDAASEPARPLSKAERRRQDDEERQRKNQRERRNYESRTAFAGNEYPVED